MFKPVPVEINNRYDFSLKDHPFSIGIPCPESAIFSPEHLQLMCAGQAKPFYATPLANWPDGSIKWFLLDFQASIDAGVQLILQLVDARSDEKPRSQPTAGISVSSPVDDEYIIDTGTARFTINKNRLGLFDQVVCDDISFLSDAASNILLIDEQGQTAESVITDICFPNPENTLRKEINLEGFFQNAAGHNLVEFKLKQTFFATSATVKCEFTLSNSRAAEHPGGVWDLGDKGSFFFKALSVNVSLVKTEDKYMSSVRLSPEADWRLVENDNFLLEQNSSGGENWQSDNHMNLQGDVPLTYKGYRCFEQDVQIDAGDRATPSLHLTTGAVGITVYARDFWQNFPKCLKLEPSSLALSLFPENDSDSYELQGGERKQHTFYLNFSNNKASLDAYIEEIIPRIPLEFYSEAKVIPWLPASFEDTTIQKLIHRGVQGDNNFFEKREIIDEFGWRNFGEIYADHEALEYKGDGVIISHYNNQYDPVFGFLKQYISTGDSRWFKLLSELAQHVVDIDIYHTVKDRDELNGGLFWHTHHYLNAFTCTHRTFSHKHSTDFLYGEIGGGPGDEHCYTTGLSYYYFMTGDETYKRAALQLVEWLSRVLEGSGAVVERLFQFKSKDLPILKRIVSGKTVQCYKYPFTRGTGNYITSLIDAYSLTDDRQYISSIETVIQKSMHPRDDISLRNLNDAEYSWSYLIYLQAVCKYLDLKTSLKEFDAACHYAKDSLLHYVDWMLENESPFLHNPEILEYPNHTWTAQDLRKANIFYIASLYSNDKKARYLEAAQYYVRYVGDTLKKEDTRDYSRILILLMQNNVELSGLDYEAARPLRNNAESVQYKAAPLYSFLGILFGFIKDIGYRLIHLSIKKERRWLSFRI